MAKKQSLRKESHEFTEVITVDGSTPALTVKLDFSRVKFGEVKIDTKLNKQHLSFNPAIQDAVLDRLKGLLLQACNMGKDLIVEFYEESTAAKIDRSQLTMEALWNGDLIEVGQAAGDGGPDDEIKPAPPKPKRGRKKKQPEMGIDVQVT